MSHEIIIIENGDGEGGSAVSQAAFKPSHDLPEKTVFKRIARAREMLAKVNDLLYAPPNDDA